MAKKSDLQQYVLLPPRGLGGPQMLSGIPGPTSRGSAQDFLYELSSGAGVKAFAASTTAGKSIKVLDSIHEGGAKLVEMTPEAAEEVRAQEPGVRIVPVVYYHPAVAPRMTVTSRPKASKPRASKTRAAVTKAAARLLSLPASASILGMPRGPARSDAMARALLQSANTLGFGPAFEGQGLPQ